jgi:hypothetical protein
MIAVTKIMFTWAITGGCWVEKPNGQKDWYSNEAIIFNKIATEEDIMKAMKSPTTWINSSI